MLGGAFSLFMGQIACSAHAVWLSVREGFARSRLQL